jgi:hypothetical protein
LRTRCGNAINGDLAKRYDYVDRALPDGELDKVVDTLYSSRTLEDVIYRAELDGKEVIHTLTRAQPPGWTRYARRSTPTSGARPPGRPRTRAPGDQTASWEGRPLLT